MADKNEKNITGNAVFHRKSLSCRQPVWHCRSSDGFLQNSSLKNNAAHLEYSSGSEDEPPVGNAGARIMLSKNINPYRRGIWIVLNAILFIWTIVQVGLRLRTYLSVPISVSIEITRNDTMEFPAVTICTAEPFNHTAMELLRHSAALALNKSLDQVLLPYDLLALMDITTLWSNMSNKLPSMVSECWLGRNKTCTQTGTWNAKPTILGPCYTFQASEPVADGSFNGLYLVFNGFSLNESAENKLLDKDHHGWRNAQEKNGWYYITHHAEANPALDIHYGDFLSPFTISSSYERRISLKKISRINAWHTRCVEDNKYSMEECKLACLSNQIISKVGCRLPFMNQESISNAAPLCHTPELYDLADRELHPFMENIDQCPCQRQCNSTVYESNTEKILAIQPNQKIRRNQVRLRVFFQGKYYEHVKEEYDYVFNKLICDIGNSVCLLMGASLLNWIEFLIWIYKVVEERFLIYTRRRISTSFMPSFT